ncbi:MAG: RluA family pseudouridine synthase [Burkholderiales bacterium]
MDITVPESCSGLRLDQALARLFADFSRSRLAAWIKQERVQLNGAPAVPSQKVWAGDRVNVEPEFDAAIDEPTPIALAVVYEDPSILVINKPPGLVVHPGAGNPGNTLLNALLHRSRTLAVLPRAGIVHRLDKDTSGLLVVAKTMSSHADLVRQLKTHAAQREYLALVHGRLPATGAVETGIGRHPRRRTQMSVLASGKPALTHFEAIERFADCTLARVYLATGRTHQIRVHMQSIGHPVVGDPVYGYKHASRKPLAAFPRQALHAARLRFLHPGTHEQVSFTAEPPADMKTLLRLVRAS